MKNVKVIASIIVLFTLLFACKPIPSKKDTTKKTDTIKQNKMVEKKDTSKRYPYIETNSLKNGFDKNLINTLVVKEKDTVLFRKWETLGSDSISLLNKAGRIFKIKGSDFVSYYKTDIDKFSTYKISIENMNKCINIYGYTNSHRLPYSMDNINGLMNLKKVSNILGRFEIYNPHSLGNYIYFTASDDGINIIKLEYMANTRGRRKNYSYVLDTLIPINSKNKFIDIKKLNKILRVDKNIKE